MRTTHNLTTLTLLTMALSFLVFTPQHTTHADEEVIKLTTSNPAVRDLFGSSVAISGTMVVVGAPSNDNHSGAVYVFDCNSTPCIELSELAASDPTTGDGFASSVAISGTTVVVGAPWANHNSGAVYIFDCSGFSCTQTNKLTPSTSTEWEDAFGFSVAVNGTMLVVGAPGGYLEDPSSGEVYLYDLNSCSATCTEVTKLTISDTEVVDYFGVSVAISGTTVVVGAAGDFLADNNNSGSVYVYDCSGFSCIQTNKLANFHTTDWDIFGESVAISGTMVVVETIERDNRRRLSGTAYIYDLSSCGKVCYQTSSLITLDMSKDDWIGISVAIDKNIVVFGAFCDETKDADAAYVFDCNSLPCTEIGKLSVSYLTGGNWFGHSVAVDDTRVVIGASHEDYRRVDSGAVYVFDISPDP